MYVIDYKTVLEIVVPIPASRSIFHNALWIKLIENLNHIDVYN